MPDVESPDPAPKVDGPIANTTVAAAWGVNQVKKALSGDGGVRLLALAAVASFTWVGTRAIDKYTEQVQASDAMAVRAGDDRVEREKADCARHEAAMRAEREAADQRMQAWYSAEREKDRRATTQMEQQRDDSNAKAIAMILEATAKEREKDRSLIFKLSGAKGPDGGIGP